MCDCGCNDCGGSKPVMLNESLAPKEILSEGLKYHMDNNMPLTEHVYRAGSQKYFDLWAEARALYSRGILEVTGDDLEVLTETDLGHYGMFEGKKVPLDFPIELNELETEEFLAAVEDEFDLETLQLMKGVIQKRVDFLKKGLDMSNPRNVVKGYRGHLTEEHIQIIYEEIKEKLNEAMVDYDFSKEELIRVIKQLKRGASTEIGMIKAFEKALGRELTDDEIRGFKLNENRIFIKTKGKRLAIDKKDLQRLKSGKDIVGYSTKYPGQEEWVLARDKWEIEGPLKEAKNINEIGDASIKPYEWVVKRSSSPSWDLGMEKPFIDAKYKFTTDKGVKYKAGFNEEEKHGYFHFGFSTEGGGIKDIVNKGEVFRVMSTIVDIFKDFIEKEEWSEIYYSSARQNYGDKRREKLYMAYLKKNLPDWIKIDDIGLGDVVLINQNQNIKEAKKKSQKKDPPIGKPMRDTSGGKAYKVYVKDPKTGNIKTVRFGSGGLRAKINDPKARQAFAKRHKCSTKKDRTKASYWSCRLPRYAKLLGLKSSFSGFW